MQLLFYAYSSFIHSLYRRVFFLSLFLLRSLTIILCWFIFFSTLGVCFIYVLCARFIFFLSSFCQKCLFFFLFVFYETAFISRFRYRFPRNISHFPNYGTFTHTYSYKYIYINISNRVIENEDV